jgi:hypothetical protein
MENMGWGEPMLKTEAEMLVVVSDKIKIDKELQRILRDILSDPRK